MFRNFLKIVFRNLRKDKFYSIINITGLSIGIATSLLIFLFVMDELSYDKFYSDSDRIYRVTTKAKLSSDEVIRVAATSAPAAEGFRQAISEIEEITRIRRNVVVIKHGDNSYKEGRSFFADSTFFRVFDIPFIQGNPENCLVEPNSMVLSESSAIKYFGEHSIIQGNIVGTQVQVDGNNFLITGVTENVPSNTHFHYDILISMSSNPGALSPNWLSLNYKIYLKLRKGINPAMLEDKFFDVIEAYAIPQAIQYMNYPADLLDDREKAKDTFAFILQPLTSIHLYSDLRFEIEGNGDISYVYIYSAISLFIIILACINFMNLATARSVKRSLEVGIRKSLGSSSKKLVRQFLLESFIFTVIAMLLALGLAEAMSAPFNYISGKEISLNIFEQPWIIFAILGLTILVTLLAGLYPAFYLTSFSPVEVLKGRSHKGGNKIFRSGLVIFQFIISIGLIICTTLVYKQMNYINERNLGFDKENVILVKNGWKLGKQLQSIKQELLGNSQIKNITIASNLPSVGHPSSLVKAEGALGADHQVFLIRGDYDYVPTLGMEIIHGRNLSEDIHSDDSAAVLINQEAANLFGWHENNGQEALGKNIFGFSTQSGPRPAYKIVGIIKDFNYESFKNEIKPVVMFLSLNGAYMAIRVNPGNHSNTIKMIESKWKELAPDVPFEYTFLDQNFERMFESEQKLGRVFGIFTALAILIACLGLFGLAAFTAEQRTKEIGVRKVMGASVSDLVGLLNRDFTKLVLISFVVASPLAWYFMDQWLKSFAYKTHIGIWPFVIAGLGAVLITWITVSYQSIKASLSNPVESLRTE